MANDITTIRDMRKKLDEKVLGYANVVGTMIGAKQKSGQFFQENVFTVLVSEKIGVELMPSDAMIPEAIQLDDITINTDVLELKNINFRKEVFEHGTLMVRSLDGIPGTLTSFCKNDSGQLYGLTCAHVFAEEDSDNISSEPVVVFSSSLNDYLEVGRIDKYKWNKNGIGKQPNYGFTDVAIFTIEHGELLERARNSTAIEPGEPYLGVPVYCFKTNGKRRTGHIHGIEARIENTFIDIFIAVDPPGTFPGDSGLLWKLEDGRPLGIHAYGQADNGTQEQGSPFSCSMLASRAAKEMNIDFLTSHDDEPTSDGDS